MRIPTLFGCCLLILVAAATGSTQTLITHEAAYHLQYGDVIGLTYRYTPEFNQDVTVGPDGQVLVAGLGSVIGRGQTLDELKKRLLILSSTRLVSPDITLTLKTYVKPHVMVEGEVNTPGRVEIHGDLSALDAIALAGGFRDSASKNNVIIFRPEPGGSAQTRVVNLSSLIKRHDLAEVPKLLPGDTLYVSSTKLSKLQQITHLGEFGAIYNPIH